MRILFYIRVMYRTALLKLAGRIYKRFGYTVEIKQIEINGAEDIIL